MHITLLVEAGNDQQMSVRSAIWSPPELARLGADAGDDRPPGGDMTLDRIPGAEPLDATGYAEGVRALHRPRPVTVEFIFRIVDHLSHPGDRLIDAVSRHHHREPPSV